jgi:hypothetical protein
VVPEATEADLSELAEFKLSMLDRLSPDYRPPQLKQALNGEALGILADIEHAIAAPLRQSRRGISAVVALTTRHFPRPLMRRRERYVNTPALSVRRASSQQVKL